MKKLLTMFVMSLLVLSSVSLISAWKWDFTQKNYNIPVIQKVPGTWTEVTNGASGNVLLSQGMFGHAIVRHAKPYTSYTLIYYGNAENNDVWNYATCISSGVTNNNGNVLIPRGNINYESFTDDGINQKFWIVPSSDVNCETGRMTAWNPNNILFESYSI